MPKRKKSEIAKLKSIIDYKKPKKEKPEVVDTEEVENIIPDVSPEKKEKIVEIHEILGAKDSSKKERTKRSKEIVDTLVELEGQHPNASDEAFANSMGIGHLPKERIKAIRNSDAYMKRIIKTKDKLGKMVDKAADKAQKIMNAPSSSPELCLKAIREIRGLLESITDKTTIYITINNQKYAMSPNPTDWFVKDGSLFHKPTADRLDSNTGIKEVCKQHGCQADKLGTDLKQVLFGGDDDTDTN